MKRGDKYQKFTFSDRQRSSYLLLRSKDRHSSDFLFSTPKLDAGTRSQNVANIAPEQMSRIINLQIINWLVPYKNSDPQCTWYTRWFSILCLLFIIPTWSAAWAQTLYNFHYIQVTLSYHFLSDAISLFSRQNPKKLAAISNTKTAHFSKVIY